MGLNAIYLVRSLSRWSVIAFCLVCPVILNGRLGMTSALLAILKGKSACAVCDLFRLSWHETSKCEPQCVITLTAVLHALITYLAMNKRRKKPQDTSLNINITVRAVMNSCSLGGGLSII